MAAWLCRICLTLLPQEENGDVKHDNKDDERDDKSEEEEEEEKEEAGKDAEKDDKDKSQVDKFDSDKESEEEKGAGKDSEKEDEAGLDLDDKANEADSEMDEEDEEGNEKAKKAKGEEKEDKEKEEEEEEEAVDKEELVDVRLNVVECCDIVFLCFGFNSMPAFLLLSHLYWFGFRLCVWRVGAQSILCLRKLEGGFLNILIAVFACCLCNHVLGFFGCFFQFSSFLSYFIFIGLHHFISVFFFSFDMNDILMYLCVMDFDSQL